MALPVPMVTRAKLKIANESRSHERTGVRVGRTVADTSSKIWCQGWASECTPGYNPLQRMEMEPHPRHGSVGTEGEGRERNGDDEQPLCTEKGHYLTSEATDSSLARLGQTEEGGCSKTS